MKSCMGGWCLRRDGCRYHDGMRSARPAERLCIPGRDGVLKPPPARAEPARPSWIPVHFTRLVTA